MRYSIDSGIPDTSWTVWISQVVLIVRTESISWVRPAAAPPYPVLYRTFKFGESNMIYTPLELEKAGYSSK